MKKIMVIFLLGILFTPAFAVNPVEPADLPVKAASIMIPVGPNREKISLERLAHMKPREYARLSQKKMNFFERAGFSLAQKKLRKSINADGTLSNKKINKMVSALEGETGFHVGGFALGFFLGIIGVLIAYLIDDDYKRNRVKWAWIGLGAIVLIILLLTI